mmetsp:Transcript_29417/g.113890  ORF Transcript_29417/g.113890 Transcript_29417/m.113890 type:complete len:258 (-) Transcript_29417:140-913(-)|eukprot:CAMPEP_0113964860 /NCGR_PEP_ID=MMETSP0011_2-20120614/7402_1 /TAXON_ID=101924 /ORGANISM="Rhodosorus marinus" /LENGTH=257 /DNA_ID=CAMNT_0000977265 /DNA_START=55 /DNA_END=828 /DNA_ORIENTATION=- /assembly_acc=CAM_ASM_000156
MVSFSCDKCQDVVKKSKVENHMWQCRAPLVSCVDCGRSFDGKNVKGHSSCMTEREKYEDGVGKPGGGVSAAQRSRDAFCQVCNLQLNGAVMSVQHYQSKKHRGAERRQKKENGSAKSSGTIESREKQTNLGNEVNGQTDAVTDEGWSSKTDSGAKATAEAVPNSSDPEDGKLPNSSNSSTGTTKKKTKKLLPVVKKIIRKQSTPRMKLDALSAEVSLVLKNRQVPFEADELPKRIKKLTKSRPKVLRLEKDVVVLSS